MARYRPHNRDNVTSKVHMRADIGSRREVVMHSRAHRLTEITQRIIVLAQKTVTRPANSFKLGAVPGFDAWNTLVHFYAIHFRYVILDDFTERRSHFWRDMIL